MIGFAVAAGILLTQPSAPRRAQMPTPRWLSEAVSSFQRDKGYPGVWVAVASRGRIVGVACSGVANVATNEPASIDQRVRIGSVSKPVLATVAAYLVQVGRLTYEDRLMDIVPELAATSDPGYRDVTLGMLLTHTAGIGADKRGRFARPPIRTEYPRIRFGEVVETLKVPPVSPIGTKWQYANYGYQTAAVLIERKLDESYEQLLGEIGKGPLGLASIGSGTPERGGTAGHTVVSGKATVVPPIPGHYAYEYGAFGTVHMSIEDLAKFGLLMCPSSGVSPLSTTTLRHIHEVVLGSQTLSGFQRDGAANKPYTLIHNGSLTVGRGDSTVLWVNPERGIVVAAYVNAGAKGPTDDVNDLKNLVVRPLFWKLMNGEVR